MADATQLERNQAIVAEYRASGGKLGGPWAGADVLLLTTTGAKSGEQRTTPVMFLREGGHLYIFASRGGAPNNPAWYHNLLAHPTVTVEVGNEKFEADATVLTGAERDRIYQRQAELRPAFAEYQQRTSRTIPVIALRRKQ